MTLTHSFEKGERCPYDIIWIPPNVQTEEPFILVKNKLIGAADTADPTTVGTCR